MTDINVFRRRRTTRDGACPTGAHHLCEIVVVSAESFAGSVYIMNRFHFDDHERPEPEFLCIDGEMASVIMNARSEGLKIRGISFLSELTGKVESVKGTVKLCRCGNTPSPVDNFCRNCRPRTLIPRRRI